MTDLSIGFGNTQVLLKVEQAEADVAFQQAFQAMLVSKENQTHLQIVGRFWVIYRANIYQLLANESGIILVETPHLEQLIIGAKYHIITALMNANPQYLWFHAGAVGNGTGAIVFPGSAGGGKSSFVTACIEQGWQYFSDDVVALDLATGLIFPVPQTPRVRSEISQVLPPERLAEIPKQVVSVSPSAIAREPLPMMGLIFPQYEPTMEAELITNSPRVSLVSLLSHCINFPQHKSRAMAILVDLVQKIPGLNLSYGEKCQAISLLLNCLSHFQGNF